MEPELIADYRCRTGEGPLWHESESRLYWVDIPAGRLFRYDPATGHHEQVYQGGVIGGFTIQDDGSLLLFGDRGSVVEWRDGKTRTVIEEIPEERDTRFNDVIADPEGRVFCGTMPAGDRPGRLYRLDLDGSLTVVIDDAGISNGLGFTPDLDQIYHTNTSRRFINRYPFDRRSGDLGEPQRFLTVPEGEGGPDGMTVDAEGYVWSARWDGHCVCRYTPSGELEREYRFPARKVSSVTFGGSDFGDLYVTTAGGDSKPEEGEGAGGLFRLRPGVQGRPEFRSRIRQ